ncbi:MAG: hypothetical protein H7328_09455 [Bdellovibrio sp.]|nr:hypothetical protein [Bdellovibrio sp.]
MNYTTVRQLILGSLFLTFFLFQTNLVLTQAGAQVTSAKNKNPFPIKYTSAVDQKIILKTITLAPVYDNVNGVYANPIQKLLIDLLQNDKVWGYSEFPNISQKIFVENFDSKPNEVLDVLAKTGSQGMLTALITKGPRGLNARLKLFTQDQGIILLEESFLDLNTFEISKLRDEFVILYHNLKNKLPYRGFVLSRRAVEVTLNLGSQNGVSLGQELTLAQILKLNRHPKLKTLVGIEREIIGRVKVTKVESYLSFAQIIFERETGVVDVGAKVLPTEYVSYPMPILNNEGDVISDEKTKVHVEAPRVEERSQPKDIPLDSKSEHIGKATIQGGLMQYAESTSLASGVSVDAKQDFSPTFLLGGQLFFLKDFFVDFNIRQSFFSADHSLAGSTPKDLSYTVSRYSGAIGYIYLIDGTPSGPQVSGAIGLTSYKTQVSATTPVALTSTQTDGISLKLTGIIPLQPEYPFAIGADAQFLVSSNFSESPVSSGSSNSTVTAVSVFATYNYSPTIRYRADLGFESINASFSGVSTRANPSKSTTIKSTSQLFGIEYLF